MRDPALAAELTLQPVRRYGVDAAVLFSDIVVPVIDFGVDVAPGTGPVVEKPFRDASDLDRLRPVPTPFVEEALRLVTAELELPVPVPVIGFAGGPFTLASYLVEGGPSQGFAKTKALMWSEPELWAGSCNAWPRSLWPACTPRWRRGRPPSRFSRAGAVPSPPPTTAAMCGRRCTAS